MQEKLETKPKDIPKLGSLWNAEEIKDKMQALWTRNDKKRT